MERRHRGKGKKPRIDKGTVKPYIRFDCDTFLECYDKWRKGEMTINKMSEVLGATAPTISSRVRYILENGGQVPSSWFTRDGRNLEDVLREEQIAELMRKQKEEMNDNGNA